MDHGKVFLIGAGPGDPKLLTVKATELLKDAKIVVYDRLVSEEILRLIPDHAEKIYVGKKAGKHVVPQEKITELLVEKALAGENVVRLKGGDPFIFGRGGEEAEALADNNIEFEVVPGVSSAVAAPMYAGIPLTHRDYASSVAIVTGHQAGDGERIVHWAEIAKSVDTLVILMGVESLKSITEKLLESGVNPSTPVAIIERGTSKHQKTLTGKLGSIAKESEEKNVQPPAVIVIGGVVELGRKLSWFKTSRR
ncbi:MAG: uroporphyrinogen-III C-methyltransferase [Candidatus Bathyarchaeota archaeon]|nr:uroporphyrinogen-III C-methyltransferase [Candidatus Bathyarchaeota archaeon]